jgi:predicted small secreted protein
MCVCVCVCVCACVCVHIRTQASPLPSACERANCRNALRASIRRSPVRTAAAQRGEPHASDRTPKEAPRTSSSALRATSAATCASRSLPDAAGSAAAASARPCSSSIARRACNTVSGVGGQIRGAEEACENQSGGSGRRRTAVSSAAVRSRSAPSRATRSCAPPRGRGLHRDAEARKDGMHSNAVECSAVRCPKRLRHAAL